MEHRVGIVHERPDGAAADAQRVGHERVRDDREAALLVDARDRRTERSPRPDALAHEQALDAMRHRFGCGFLCIASGYIPPRLNILSQLDADGNVIPTLQESVDDDWLLISAENES